VDEGRLINILQHSAKLEVLRIGCQFKRSLAIINLIISTREKFLQCGSPLSLQSFELMGEGLVPVDMYELSNSLYGHITSTLRFSKDVKTFDMFTDVMFACTSSRYDPALDFVRNYGWTVEKLVLPYLFNDNFARIILDAVKGRGSRITTLNFAPFCLSTAGMGALDEIIEMSPNAVSIGMRCYLENKINLQNFENSLMRHKAQLHHLDLFWNTTEYWSSQITRIIPTRDVLPKMGALTLDGYHNQISMDCITWIVAMISAPPQTRSATAATEPVTRLKRITLRRIVLSPEDWESVIRAIDLTEVEWLDLQTTNFAKAELRLLVNHIIDNAASQTRVLSLCINDKLLEQEEARTLCATLREKVPLVKFN
ncbi:hypothetical protein BGX34_005086, partial [Mortierella sp. NVP85]